MIREPLGNSARLVILIPTFNDWECLKIVVAAICDSRGLPQDRRIVVVDDGSTIQPVEDMHFDGSPVEVLRLGANMGHQRAIAVGLVALASDSVKQAVIVMDADGEDLPGDCEVLWEKHRQEPASVIVAQRRKRNESAQFRLFYSLYRRFFKVLTGQTLDFGNFSLIPASALKRLVLMPELWNHYPATVMKSRVKIERVPLDRGQRIAGESKMNFISLVNHGLAAIAAFADTAYARLLAWSVICMGVLSTTIVAGVIYRLVSGNPLPGWLALGGVAAFVAVFQLIAALVVVSFFSLSQRAQPALPPTQVAGAYIAETVLLKAKDSQFNE